MPKIRPGETETKTIKDWRSKIKLFPSIFRIITERLNLSKGHIVAVKITALSLVIVYLLIATASQSRLYNENRAHLESLKQKRISLEKQASFWNDVAKKYENYPDAYLKLAQIEYRLGNASLSEELLNKALVLNPELKQRAVLGEFVGIISD